jgi:hypothetical protein
VAKKTKPADPNAAVTLEVVESPKPTKRERLANARNAEGLTLKEMSFLTAYMSPTSPAYGDGANSARVARLARTQGACRVEAVRMLTRASVQAAIQKRLNEIPDEARWAIKKISETQTPMLVAQLLKKIGPKTQVNVDNSQHGMRTLWSFRA